MNSTDPRFTGLLFVVSSSSLAAVFYFCIQLRKDPKHLITLLPEVCLMMVVRSDAWHNKVEKNEMRRVNRGARTGTRSIHVYVIVGGTNTQHIAQSSTDQTKDYMLVDGLGRNIFGFEV